MSRSSAAWGVGWGGVVWSGGIVVVVVWGGVVCGVEDMGMCIEEVRALEIPPNHVYSHHYDHVLPPTHNPPTTNTSLCRRSCEPADFAYLPVASLLLCRPPALARTT